MFYLFCFLDSHRTQHEWSCHQLSQKFANPLLALVLTKKQSLVSFLHILDSSAQFFSMWTQPINKYWQRFGVRAFHRPEESPLRCSMHAFVALFQLWSSFLTLKYRSYWRHISVVFCTHSCKAISRGRSEPIYETYFTCCHSINKLLSNHSYFHFQKSCYSLRRIKKLMGGSMGGSGWIQHVFTCRSIPQMQYKRINVKELQLHCGYLG